jgi:hypothetical protein
MIASLQATIQNLQNTMEVMMAALTANGAITPEAAESARAAIQASHGMGNVPQPHPLQQPLTHQDQTQVEATSMWIGGSADDGDGINGEGL